MSMFTCSKCGFRIDAARLPDFCPRCGTPAKAEADSIGALVDDDDLTMPLPPPPPSGRGAPSKTLFGMPGISFDQLDDEGATETFDRPLPPIEKPPIRSASPGGTKPAAPPAKAPAASSAKPPAASPAKPPAAPPARPPAAPPVRPPALASGAAPKPGGAVKPPPIGGAKPPSPPPTTTKPPPVPNVAKPPTIGAPPKPPAAPPKPPTAAPAKPPVPASKPPRPPAAAPLVASGDSGTFDEDPFFTGDPDQMSELGSITSGEVARLDQDELSSARSGMREFEFEAGGEALELGELDLPGADGRAEVVDLPRATRDAGEFDEFDLASPGPRSSGGYGTELELPTPVTDATDGLDLPTPLGRPVDDDLDLPAPAGSPMFVDDSLDIASPVEGMTLERLDADSSWGRGSSTPRSPSHDHFSADHLELDDLPTPADNLPIPIDELPLTLDDELAPGPKGSVIRPKPTGARVDDFPGIAIPDIPDIDDELPLPADDLPIAADNLPTPADILPAPIDDLELDLDGEGEATTAHARKPERAPASSKPTSSGATQPAIESKPAAKPGSAPGRVTKPGKPEREPKPGNRTRVIVYGVLGLFALAGAVGVYGLGQGWFEPELPPPVARGAGGGTGAPVEPPDTPAGEIAERPEAVLAKLDEDTPAAFVQVVETLAQDPVGKAEAALLLHLRYGPDPERLARALEWLTPYAANQEPHVRRVLGLAALAQGLTQGSTAPQLAAAFGDDPRARLYASWAALANPAPDLELAASAVEQARSARASDQAAVLTGLEIQLSRDPEQGLAALREHVEDQPNHLRAQVVLLHALVDQGLLAEAAKLGAELPAAPISGAHKAELLRTRARIAREQGNLGEAARLLEQAAASDEQAIAPLLDRVDLRLASQELGAARAEIEGLLKQHADDPEVLLMAARVDIAAGRQDDAIARVQPLEAAQGMAADMHEQIGNAHALQLKVAEARQAWAKARELDPLHTSATLAEVRLLTKSTQTDQALALLDEQRKALAAHPQASSLAVRRERATIERLQAELLRSLGRSEDALAAADEALALFEGDNQARLLRAELLAALGQIEAHEQTLEQLHARTGGFPGLTEPLGRMLLRKGKLDELEQLIGTQLDAPEASAEMLLTGAALRLAQNKADQAQVLAQRVLDRDPNQVRAHLLLGRALLAQGEYALALDEIESAQTREGDPEVEIWLGQALEYNARSAEARPHYKRALELEPGNLEASALLGRLYAYEGAAKQALALLEPVVQKTDAYPYAYLAIGIAHRDLGKRDQAVGELQRARELDPTLFEAYYEEGRIHNDRNKHAAAASTLQAGIDNAKDHAQPRQLEDAWRRLGDSYYELGRKADAKKAFEEYLKLAAPSAPGRKEVQRLMRDL